MSRHAVSSPWPSATGGQEMLGCSNAPRSHITRAELRGGCGQLADWGSLRLSSEDILVSDHACLLSRGHTGLFQSCLLALGSWVDD